ncbi:MAG: hypothetical protein IJ849_07305 [Selenomonadaceae bacterium]|nr:hypothetical protein [Selenomonadaceae bacterium]
MLKMIEGKKIVPLEVARSEYPKTKKIFIVTDMANMSDIKGYLYMVSEDITSFDDLCQERYKLYDKGIQSIIIGSYENGGAIGVQYEF